MKPYVVGIDPGFSGAIAVLNPYGDLIHVLDMPVAGEGPSRRVQGLPIRELVATVAKLGPVLVAVEKVHAMPKQGVSSSFRFGTSYGVALGAVAGFRLELVAPSVWKSSLKLSRKAKDASRLAALDRWPSKADHFQRKKDDGRAEAALIALYAHKELS